MTCKICGSDENDKHSGVIYKLSKGEIDLCLQCDMELLGEMLKQFVVENKFRRVLYDPTETPCPKGQGITER